MHILVLKVLQGMVLLVAMKNKRKLKEEQTTMDTWQMYFYTS